MNWSDKMQKEVNAKRKQAKKEEATYFGPTACSVLVEKQADKVINEIATNLFANTSLITRSASHETSQKQLQITQPQTP